MTPLTTYVAKYPHMGMSLLVLLIGVLGGISAIVFHYLIEFFQFIFYGSQSSDFLSDVVTFPWYARILIPTLGGLIVGIILTHKKIADAEGEGVPEVIEAVRLEKSTIRPIIGPAKALVSAINIGSGGAGGREGPVIQIGSALGSSIGQLFNLHLEQKRTLLAAGAAAAIAGTFGAPIAGIVFAYEILLKKVTVVTSIFLATASLTGMLVARLIIGHAGSLLIPEVTYPTPVEMLLLCLFGIVAGVIGILFTYTLSSTEHIFRRCSIPRFLKPALGGLLLGLLALYLPQVHEPAAYGVISKLLSDTSVPFLFCVLLILAKIIATSLTVGSGGSGGILAPSLFIGALSGTAYAKALSTVSGDIITDPVQFAILGMGAVFAAVSHAPFTAIALIFEFTDSFVLLIPLGVACYIASMLSEKIGKRSVYGIHFTQK